MPMSNDNNFSTSLKMKLLQIDATHVALPDNRVSTVVDWTTPAALPFAPASVLGVVCIHGRMFTLIDPHALFERNAYVPPASRSLIVALQGDEQLALAADTVDGAVEVSKDEIGPAIGRDEELCAGTFPRNGAQIFVLNPDAIFSIAMKGRERRRRRI